MEELVIGALRILGALIRWLLIELCLDRVVICSS